MHRIWSGFSTLYRLSPEATHMVTFLFSPWGIPANYRQMQGSGVNTYKWVNQEGTGVLIKYHWEPLNQGIRNLLQKDASEIQGQNFNHATLDLYHAIEKGDYPEWELCVQVMEDGEHPELDFDPLDPTKLWPQEQFPFLPVGKMTLNRNPEDYFNEVEQAAFGTGVLVDGLDFSDDKTAAGTHLLLFRYPASPGGCELSATACECAEKSGSHESERRTDAVSSGSGAGSESACEL